MRNFLRLDLSKLPAPRIGEDWTFAAIFGDYKQAFLEEMATLRAQDPTIPAFDAQTIETEPAVRLLRVAAFRECLLRQRINEAALAVMWGRAQAEDLDNLAPLVGLERRVIIPADPNANPPRAALIENDDEFRARGPYALDATAIGLVGGGYKTLILQAEPAIKDIALLKYGGGRLDLILLGRGPDGSVAQDVVDRVNALVLADNGGQLTDIVSARSARPRGYAIRARATIPKGPSPSLVEEAMRDGLIAATQELAIGRAVAWDALIAAGRMKVMTKFALIEPAGDLIPAGDEVLFPQSIEVEARPVDG